MPDPGSAAATPAPHPRRWLQRRRAHRLFLAPDRVYALDTGGGEALPDLAQWLALHPGTALHIVLSGRLLYPLVANEPGLARAAAADQQAWARQQCLHFHGPDSAAWPVVLAATPPTLTAALLHGADLVALQSLAQRHDARLASLQPWWTTAPRALARRLPQWPAAGRAALVLLEGAHAAWLGFEDGRLVAIEQRRAAAASAAAVAELLAEWQEEHAVAPKATALTGFGLQGAGPELAARAQLVGDPGARAPDPALVLP